MTGVPHDHDWEPGNQGRVFRCTICGATAIRVTEAASPPQAWWKTKWAFLAGGLLLFAVIWFFAG